MDHTFLTSAAFSNLSEAAKIAFFEAEKEARIAEARIAVAEAEKEARIAEARIAESDVELYRGMSPAEKIIFSKQRQPQNNPSSLAPGNNLRFPFRCYCSAHEVINIC
jgi:hypothetical protein